MKHSFCRGIAILAMLGVVSGCSTITQGTDQDITINTTPTGATCKLERQGQQIGMVENTPATITVSKLKHDITIICDKDGYQTATFINDSGWESGSGAAGIALDVIVTAGLSSAIDSATGADNRYQSPVNITLNPSPQTAPQVSRASNAAALAAGAKPISATPYETTINWSSNRIVKGVLIGFIPSSDAGVFKLETNNPTWACYGEWWPTKASQRSASVVAEGQWKMNCDKQGSVTGVYRMDSSAKGAFRGSDGTGEYVEILISQSATQTSEVIAVGNAPNDPADGVSSTAWSAPNSTSADSEALLGEQPKFDQQASTPALEAEVDRLCENYGNEHRELCAQIGGQKSYTGVYIGTGLRRYPYTCALEWKCPRQVMIEYHNLN